MTEFSASQATGGNALARAWNLITAPIIATTKVLVGVLAEIANEAQARPMTWSAIFSLAGAMGFLVHQYHLGALFLSCLGMLWMWLDAIETPREEAGQAEALA